jgi:hypothetical protein
MKFEQSLFDNAYNFDAYKALIIQLLAQKKTTGTDHSAAMINYTELNVVRLKRGEKQAKLSAEQIDLARKGVPQYWLLITEAWCGDAAANLAIINELANASPNVELKIILRDENPDIMDAFLTNGGKSIPKLVLITKKDLTDYASWGPRPAFLQNWLAENKKTEALNKSELTEGFQKWYAKDRGQSTANEILELMDL